MCKWEWPFVFTETKTNKYPLRTEARFFFNFFIFNKEKQKQFKAICDWQGTWILLTLVKWFAHMANSASKWHCLWKHKGQRVIATCNLNHHFICLKKKKGGDKKKEEIQHTVHNEPWAV